MPMPMLSHLRVLELGTGVAAPYAGRLLAMLGAQVRKLEPPEGDPARGVPVDDRPLRGISPLYRALSAGKTPAGGRTLAEELAQADIVLDSRVRAQVAGTVLEPERLRQHYPGVGLVSVTAWGFAAAEPGTVADELLVQAASGVTTTTGDPGREPLRLPGWQAQYFAGAHAAVAALTLALCPPPRPHIDIPWVSTIATGTEGGFQRAMFLEEDPPPAGAHAPVVFPSGAIPCADGFMAPGTVRAADWTLQCLLYGIPGLEEDPRFATPAARAAHVPALFDLIRPWYAARSRRAIFEGALDLGLAMGMVLTAQDALTDPHLTARGFLTEYEDTAGRFRAPARPFLVTGSEKQGEQRPSSRTAPPLSSGPLAGLRIIELTTAWAGPFVGKTLGALGAEVVRVESPRTYDGWRGPVQVAPGATGPYPGGIPGDRPYNRTANFNALNRNKRHVALDLTHPAARDAFLTIVAGADAVVCNFTARVLPNLGLDYARLAAVNPGIVLVTMPALGASGPYHRAAGYGTIIEAMGGIGAALGYPEEGARISQTYYPDPVAGVHAAAGLLAGVAQRRQTGAGCAIDLSQQDVMWLQQSEAIVLAATEGRNPRRAGNAEPGCAPAGMFPTADGRWLAVVARTDEEFARLAARCPALAAYPATAGGRLAIRAELEADLAAWTVTHPAQALVEWLEAAGVGVALAQTYRSATREPRMLAVHAYEVVTGVDTGTHPYLRVPFLLDGRPLDTRLPAAPFGQDTDAVLSGWAALTAEQIAALRAAGAVRDAPMAR